MPRFRLNRLILVLLLALVVLPQTACTIPPVCDPSHEDFDLSKCNETALGIFWFYLTRLISGRLEGQNPALPFNCPERLVCVSPNCYGPVQQNGGFEASTAAWYGDQMSDDSPACEGARALEFLATTPGGPSASVSSQVYQVFDYKALIPQASRATMRRVRVRAAMRIDATPRTDLQFGIQINAYTGDPAAFPQGGDPEAFLPTVPGLLDSTRQTTLFRTTAGVQQWQPVRAELELPQGTDYFVVFLEAVEDSVNDVTGNEFDGHFMDDVDVVIDEGNTAPVAAPDRRQTPLDQPVVIPVLRNDLDHTSRLDQTSITIEQPSVSGTSTPNPDGTVTFQPNPGFIGNASFSYSVADEEGLRSNIAPVSVLVFQNAGTCPAQSQLVCTNPNAPFCSQRVVNGDFASPLLNPAVLPAQTHIWSGIGMETTGRVQAIVPCQGSQMLQFVTTEDNPFQSSILSVIQLVDLRDAATQSAIAAGGVTLKARALFNRVAGDAETDTQFVLHVLAIDGDPSDFPNRIGTPLSANFTILFSDANPGTWEEAYVELVLEPRTTYAAIRIVAHENVVNDFPPGVVEFDGHYVDNVLVVLDR